MIKQFTTKLNLFYNIPMIFITDHKKYLKLNLNGIYYNLLCLKYCIDGILRSQ